MYNSKPFDMGSGDDSIYKRWGDPFPLFSVHCLCRTSNQLLSDIRMKSSCAEQCARIRISNVSPSLDLCWNICVWHWFGVQLSLDDVWFEVHTGFRCLILGVDPTLSHCVRLWSANLHELTKKAHDRGLRPPFPVTPYRPRWCDRKRASLSVSVAPLPLRMFLELRVPFTSSASTLTIVFTRGVDLVKDDRDVLPDDDQQTHRILAMRCKDPFSWRCRHSTSAAEFY